MNAILIIALVIVIYVAVMEFALYKIWKNNNDR